jgi:hypothetical protein
VRLLERLARALAPDGELVVVDALGGGTPEREAARALYRLHLSLRTAEGTVHDRPTIEEFVRRGGLHAADFIEVEAWPRSIGAIVARP